MGVSVVSGKLRDTLGRFYTILYKADNFFDFMFAYQGWGHFVKARWISSQTRYEN